MTFQFEVADRLRAVEVTPHHNGYLVTVDGRTRFVSAVRVDGQTLSLLIGQPDSDESRSIEAAVVPLAGDDLVDVHLDGVRVPVATRNGHERRRVGPRAQTTGAQRMTAPMPGKIVRVLVKAGEVVKRRQVLVVVEAMKMENELRATRDGTVSAVFVSEGQSVEAGTALVTVD
jgi:biotin carboxyl carrier protein